VSSQLVIDRNLSSRENAFGTLVEAQTYATGAALDIYRPAAA
jgi:hypothetical protein